MRRARPVARLLAVLSVALSLGGCGSISEKMSETVSGMPGVGLPANAPERPAEVRAFPAVHDMPPPRTTALMDGPEQTRMQTELVSARELQKAAAAPPPEPAPAPPPPPAAAARKKPAPKPAASAAAAPAAPGAAAGSSSRSIY